MSEPFVLDLSQAARMCPICRQRRIDWVLTRPSGYGGDHEET